MADWPWLVLFVSAFTSATLLPGSSELVVVSMWWQGADPWWLWCVASTGNVLGSCVNYWLGSQVLRFQHRRWFPASHDQLQQAQAWFDRWGYWSILFSWVPVIGDPLTVIAGVLKTRFWLFFGLVLIAKAGRYAVLLLIAQQML